MSALSATFQCNLFFMPRCRRTIIMVVLGRYGWNCLWVAANVMGMVFDVGGESSSYTPSLKPSLPTLSTPHLMLRFLTELRSEYFPSCTLVLLHDSPDHVDYRSSGGKTSPENEMMVLVDLILKQDTLNSHLVFTLNESLPTMLRQVDITALTRCPVYISVTWVVGGMLWFLRDPLWDWDKYLTSRKHVIFSLGPADLTAEALQVKTYP